MNFKTNCKKWKNNTLQDIVKSNNFCINFNHLSLNFWNKKNKHPKIIIIGTFTPYDGRKKEFFYSSKKNNQLFFIDEKLLILKNKLQENSKNNLINDAVINEILEQLYQKGIMLLDIIKASIDKTITSASDTDIAEFCLAKEDFKHYIYNENVNFIFNSRNSEYAFKLIFDDIDYIKDTRFFYLPQISRRIKKETLKNKWRDLLRKMSE